MSLQLRQVGNAMDEPVPDVDDFSSSRDNDAWGA